MSDARAQLLGVELSARWAHATPDLQALARGLYTELGPLTRGAAFPLPAHKARLTRRGGRCEHDATPLNFAPWQAHTHVCPACETVYRGREHDDWWALGAQLWCAERTLHAAILGSMWNDHSLLMLAQRALDTYSDRWETYPNRDNVLGPSRLFFSTYLESVWLLNVSLAAHVLRSYGEHRAGGADESRSAALTTVNRFISCVVEPCRDLIASYPEGLSNRQTWHSAALLASASLLRDTAAVAPLIDGTSGVSTLIRGGLLDDGTWYEGENYHLFAHRGLWYGVTLLESLGGTLSPAINARYAMGFRTPFLGVLPDGTFPSRRDSRYAVSVHQWRFAEWCELGLQRTHDDVLRVWLHRLYGAQHERADTGRSRSTADIERDEPAQQLSRSDLGWRTLLFARNEPWSELVSAGEGSVMLPAQGLNVLRRDADRIYVAIEGGHTGGGHGHPDRLALTIQDGSSRVLEDPGTGSYVEKTLHWYRSTLAHNAPLINGRSQRRVAAHLLAFESRSGVAWTRVRASELAPRVCVERTAVLLDEHVVDRVEWKAGTAITFDLPIHVRGETADLRVWTSAQPYSGGGLEDGVEFVRDAECTSLQPGEWVCVVRPTQDGSVQPANVTPPGNETGVRCWYALSGGGELWRAIAPGPPGRSARRMYWLRACGQHGEIVGIWSLRASVETVRCAVDEPLDKPSAELSDKSEDQPHHQGNVALEQSARSLLPVYVVMHNGTTAVHAAAPHGWHIDLRAGSARSSLDLEGLQQAHDHGASMHVAMNDSMDNATEKERPTLQATSMRAADIIESKSAPTVNHVLAHHTTSRFVLGEQHYRRSEQSWHDADCPTATVELTTDGITLHITVTAHTGPVVVPERNATNPLDNERPDVNADGLQLYIAPIDASDWTGAWLIVPHAVGARVTPLTSAADTYPVTPDHNAGAQPELELQSTHTDTGWTMQIALRLDAYGLSPDRPFRFDLIVNERPRDRERRRGQLVLSGARGEFVYLRGDRHDQLRSWVLQCVPAHASRSLS